MLERKWTSLVHVALGACRLIAHRRLHLPWIQTTVGRMAVDAMNCAFLQAMPEGFVKRRLRLLVAVDA